MYLIKKIEGCIFINDYNFKNHELYESSQQRCKKNGEKTSLKNEKGHKNLK